MSKCIICDLEDCVNPECCFDLSDVDVSALGIYVPYIPLQISNINKIVSRNDKKNENE